MPQSSTQIVVPVKDTPFAVHNFSSVSAPLPEGMGGAVSNSAICLGLNYYSGCKACMGVACVCTEHLAQ